MNLKKSSRGTHYTCAFVHLSPVDVYHGSNSWMMLSNRMTANNLEAKPAMHARAKMVNVNKLL